MVWRKSRQNEWFRRGVRGNAGAGKKLRRLPEESWNSEFTCPECPGPWWLVMPLSRRCACLIFNPPLIIIIIDVIFTIITAVTIIVVFVIVIDLIISPLWMFFHPQWHLQLLQYADLCWNSGHSAADIATSVLLSTTELSEGQKTSVSERNSPNPKT